MNCDHCKYNLVCGDKEYWQKMGYCDDFLPEEWGVAKRKYEKELQEAKGK